MNYKIALLLGLLFQTACSHTTDLAVLRSDVIASVADLEERTLIKGDASIRYMIGGQGDDTILLIHGLGANGMMAWGSQVRALSKEYRVVIPDLLWFGQSHATTTPSLRAQTNAMRDLLDHEGIDKVHIIGVSYGGFVTMDFTMQTPERVKSTVIIDSPGPQSASAAIENICTQYNVDNPEDVFVPRTPEGVQRLMELAMHRSIPQFPKAALEDLHAKVFSTYPDQQRALIRELTNMAPEEFPRIDNWSTPTLVIWGEYDTVFPVAIGRQLASTLNAPIVVVPDTAHTPNQEKPRVVNKEILSFLAAQP
jgi:pimeloyl-ACP methyl ester carboxylesterase